MLESVKDGNSTCFALGVNIKMGVNSGSKVLNLINFEKNINVFA